MIAPTEIPARRANTIQVMKMGQALTHAGHETLLVAPESQRSQADPAAKDWANLAKHYGLQVEFPVEWRLARPRLRRYDYSLRALGRARQWGADLIYTRLPQAAAFASWLGMATVFEAHDLPAGRLGAWLFRRFLDGPGARRLVSITQALIADLQQRYTIPGDPNFTIVAPDGIDLERYQNLPDPEQARRALLERGVLSADRFQPDRFTAGYTGHLYPGRGVGMLVALAKRLPEIQFLIVGGEPGDINYLEREMQTESQFAQDKPRLSLTGFVPNAELPHYQAACDALLMPYQQQVAASSGGNIARYLSPMKLFEYLACERVILSSDLPVLQEVLNAQNALILPANDPEAWVSALQNLQTNPQSGQALAAQARQDAAKYTWDARANRILEGLKL